MLEIRAIIRPNHLEQLRTALRALPNFPGMTVLNVEGFTAPSLISKRTAAEELTDFTPKLMLIILTPKSGADTIQQIIRDECSTGVIGDGLVWTIHVDKALRIKDGSRLDIKPSPSP